MTDDIVEQLRCWPRDIYNIIDLKDDAADEIERLRKEVDIKGSRLDDALDEIERLRRENTDLIIRLHWAHKEVLAEIEWLRTAGDNLVAAIRNHDLQEAHLKAWEEARRG